MAGTRDRAGVLLRFVEQLTADDLAALREVVARADPDPDELYQGRS